MDKKKIPAKFLLSWLFGGLAILFLLLVAIAKSTCCHSVDIFEEVWRIVDRTYYDRGFNGYDWKSVHDTFRAKLLNQDENASRTADVIDEMLRLLESSHLAFIPAWQAEANPEARPAMGLLLPDSFAVAGLAVTDFGHAKTPVVLSIDPTSPLYAEGVRTGQHIAFPVDHEQNDGKITFAVTRSDGSAFECQEDIPKVDTAAQLPFLSEDGKQIVLSRLDPISFLRLSELANSLRTQGMTALYQPLNLVTTLSGRSVPLRVIDVTKDSPADRAGIEIDAQLLQFSHTHAKNGTPGHFSATLRLPDGTSKRLEADEAAFAPAWLPDQRSARTIGQTRVIRFDQFSDQNVAWALQQIRNQPNEPLILDFRNNIGGSLSSTLHFLAALLPAGTLIGEETTVGTSTMLRIPEEDSPITARLALLVGPASASAAEVVAATLQTHKRGIVLGWPTSGDVLVSRTYKLRGGAELQIPISNFRDANGQELEGLGVSPDILVWNDLASIRDGRDIPLQRALEILAAKK